MMRFGLIGRSLEHSFSPQYFNRKFQNEHLINCRYDAFEMNHITEFPELIQRLQPLGLNVTIPYKTEVLRYITKRSAEVDAIGACNTLLVKGKDIMAFNTDWIGFLRSLPERHFKKAAILGTGGASKAIQYALSYRSIPFDTYSRAPADSILGYEHLNLHLNDYDLIVNTTPVGMHPEMHERPPIQTEKLKPFHFVYDLIYNPEETQLLSSAKKTGCTTQNGYRMLVEQAEAAWKIWNQKEL